MSYSAVHTVPSDNFISVEDAYEMVKSMSWTIYRSFRGLYYVMSREDFVQEAITHFMEKGYLEKFNSTITNRTYFILVGLRNLAIDLVRRSSRKSNFFVEVSEIVQGEEKEVSIYEITEDVSEFSAISYMILEETVNVLSKANGLKDKIFETDLMGTVWLSEYHVFKMSIVGMCRKDIAEVFGVTEATVGNYMKRAADKMHYWYVDKN